MELGFPSGQIAVCRIAVLLSFAAGLAMLAAPSAAQAAELQTPGTPEPGLPTGVCTGGFCGPAQRAIWTRFERGAGLAAAPRAYAGICYVHDRLYDPNHEHHVGFVIEETGAADETTGAAAARLFLRFSFFAAANPFDGLDAAGARARLGEAGTPATAALPVALHDGYAYADTADRTFFARYWFRRDPVSGRVSLVSYFGDRMTILCDAAATGA